MNNKRKMKKKKEGGLWEGSLPIFLILLVLCLFFPQIPRRGPSPASSVSCLCLSLTLLTAPSTLSPNSPGPVVSPSSLKIFSSSSLHLKEALLSL
jgi:hypothetical protein